MGGGKGGTTQEVQQTQFDPLYPGSGGSDIRGSVYGDRANRTGQWMTRADTAAGNLDTRAADPFWGQAYNNFQAQSRGDYLAGSPQLDGQISGMRQQSQREQGDTQADIKSRYARTGQTLSTGVNQQLLQSGAAARARSDANQSAIIGQNYVRERDFQNRAPQSAEYVSNIPGNLAAQATGLQFDPMGKSSQLATSMSGGASTNNPTVIQKPGALDYALGFTSALG